MFFLVVWNHIRVETTLEKAIEEKKKKEKQRFTLKLLGSTNRL